MSHSAYIASLIASEVAKSEATKQKRPVGRPRKEDEEEDEDEMVENPDRLDRQYNPMIPRSLLEAREQLRKDNRFH